MTSSNMERYRMDVGSAVLHVKDASEAGIITELDDKFDLGEVTTCRVVWGADSLEDALATPREDQDIQWTNKLVAIRGEPDERAEVDLLDILQKADPLFVTLPALPPA